MIDPAALYLAKARESLAGAESEFANQRYNNCANRTYYACFQAAISALVVEGIRPVGGEQAGWAHSFVQARFSDLVTRRKRYPASLRGVLSQTLMLRQTGDYEVDPVTVVQARRSLDRARALVSAVGG
jgi:uncharacterized protein (UPF0332 family)